MEVFEIGLLEKKVAIITGASSGIGRAAAMLFAAEGAAVVVNARSEDAQREVAERVCDLGGRAVAVAGDVSWLRTSRWSRQRCNPLGRWTSP